MSKAITITILPSNNMAIISQEDYTRFITDEKERSTLDSLLNQVNDLIKTHDSNLAPGTCQELY